MPGRRATLRLRGVISPASGVLKAGPLRDGSGNGLRRTKQTTVPSLLQDHVSMGSWLTLQQGKDEGQAETWKRGGENSILYTKRDAILYIMGCVCVQAHVPQSTYRGQKTLSCVCSCLPFCLRQDSMLSITEYASSASHFQGFSHLFHSSYCSITGIVEGELPYLALCEGQR